MPARRGFRQISPQLAEDVVFYSDGGGKVTVARHLNYGTERVARFFAGLNPELMKDAYWLLAQ